MGDKHDRLLDLVEKISKEDPFAALRLLHVCVVNRFGHVLGAVYPQKVQEFADNGDEDIASKFDAIQQEPPPDQSTHSLPLEAGGDGLTSLGKHPSGSYLGAFFRIVGPFRQRLTSLGGSTNRSVVAALQDSTEAANSLDWAKHVCEAHKQAKSTQDSFTAEDLYTTDLEAPRGDIIFSSGDTSSVVEDLPPTIETVSFRRC
jgi:hypothetical protein